MRFFFAMAVWLAMAVAVRAAETIVLDAKDAKIEQPQDGMAKYETIPNRLCIGFWHSTNIVARWSLNVPAKSAYRVVAVLSCMKGSEGAQFEVRVAGQRAAGFVPSTDDWGRFVELDLGPVLLRKPGPAELTVQAITMPHGSAMNLRAVRLVPEG